MKYLFKIKGTSFEHFLRYNFQHKKILLAVFGLSFIVSGAKAAPSIISKYLVDNVLINQDSGMLILCAVGFVGTSVIGGIASYTRLVLSGWVNERVVRDIKQDVFEHLQTLPMSYYHKNKLGDILARMSGDVSMLGNIGFEMFEILTFIITVTVLLGRMLFLDLTLTVVTLVFMPLVFLSIAKFGKKIKKRSRDQRDLSGNLIGYLQEALSGVFVIKSFTAEDDTIEKFNKINDDTFHAGFKMRKVAAKLSPINEVIGTLMIVGVMLYGGMEVIKNPNFTAGDLVSFITALGLMLSPLKKIIKRLSGLQIMLPAADRVIEILHESNPITDDELAISAAILKKEITFNNVKFKYNIGDEEVLCGINLKVNRGETVAFVGTSGSGKTTLVNLIPRFYDVTGGSIKIDGRDIRDIKLKSHRDRIGIVPQETFLFSGTIYSNIEYGTHGLSEEEVHRAAKMANAYNFIQDLEDGFDTEVGERGVLLSGGQKQRIAIARALLRNPEILILDEATSALDTESERLVQEALNGLMKGRTTFVIAHRLSTIINADKIVVMSKGIVVESGSHRELLENKGMYKKLYDTQFNETN